MLAHAHRGAEWLGAAGRVGLEARHGLLAVHAQGVGVGAHIADGEGARGKVLGPHLLDGVEVGALDLGGVGQVLQAAALVLARGAQSRAEMRRAFDHRTGLRLAHVHPRGHQKFMGNRAGIQWHGYIALNYGRGKHPRHNPNLLALLC